MKPADFAYARPRTVDETLALLQQHGDGARLLAGGQTLVPTLNMRLSAPEIVVDINGLDELRGVTVDGPVLRVGALTRYVEIEHEPLIAEHAPLLRTAVAHVAHPAVRNRGTIGGSIAFADPAAEMPACALALEATICLHGPGGARRVPAADFFLDLYETARADDEIVAAIEYPVATPDMRHGFRELARRHGDYAIVGVAAQGGFRDGTADSLRLAFFGMGNVPVLARRAATAATGQPLTAEVIEAACKELSHDLDPSEDLHATAAMKLHLASVLTRRLLTDMAA